MAEIPPITDPMGRYWKQPSRDRILIDDKHALMDRDTFALIEDYSSSMPSGVYEGKMWRRFSESKWHLVWYGPSLFPNSYDVNRREILIV